MLPDLSLGIGGPIEKPVNIASVATTACYQRDISASCSVSAEWAHWAQTDVGRQVDEPDANSVNVRITSLGTV